MALRRFSNVPGVAQLDFCYCRYSVFRGAPIAMGAQRFYEHGTHCDCILDPHGHRIGSSRRDDGNWNVLGQLDAEDSPMNQLHRHSCLCGFAILTGSGISKLRLTKPRSQELLCYATFSAIFLCDFGYSPSGF
jgi:hypothetical protein